MRVLSREAQSEAGGVRGDERTDGRTDGVNVNRIKYVASASRDVISSRAACFSSRDRSHVTDRPDMTSRKSRRRRRRAVRPLIRRNYVRPTDRPTDGRKSGQVFGLVAWLPASRVSAAAMLRNAIIFSRARAAAASAALS